MRKILLLTALVISSSILFAQMPVNKRQALQKPNKSSLYKADKVSSFSMGPVKQSNYSVKNINILGKIPFAASYNIFTALVSHSNCLTYNPEINTLMFTHRPGGSYGGNANQLTYAYTSDLGSTFNYITLDDPTCKVRYPSGVIFNPAGNTDPANAYAIAMGPSLIGANWDSYFIASSRLDSTNTDFTSYPDNAPPMPQYFPRYGFASCNDSTQHILGIFDESNHATGSYNLSYLAMNNFKYNNSAAKGGFDWNTSIVKVPLFNAPTDGIDVYSSYNTAWSEDGSVGYMWIFGVDSLDVDLATVPLVYKSTDKGTTWNALPDFDFTTNATIMAHLNDWWQGTLGYSGNPRINFVDWYSSSDGVVDANGELHIFTLVNCGFGVTKDPDSLGYIYSYEPKVIYDVHTTSTGWNAWVVDTILTEYVEADLSGWGAGNDAVGWDHRIQASRTPDGSKIFCVWTDSDTTFTAMNNLPDVLARGYDINSGFKTPVVNFTANTNYDGDNYFMYVADRIIVQGNDFTIPIVTTAIGATPDNEQIFELLTGVTFNQTDFTSGIKSFDDNNTIVYQNYPNPFKDFTNIDITLKNSAKVVVTVYNMIGQEVRKIETGTLGSGTHTIRFDKENLNSGVYFYNVSTGNNSTAGKMIIE